MGDILIGESDEAFIICILSVVAQVLSVTTECRAGKTHTGRLISVSDLDFPKPSCNIIYGDKLKDCSSVICCFLLLFHLENILGFGQGWLRTAHSDTGNSEAVM